MDKLDMKSKDIISSNIDGILLTKENEEVNSNEIITQVTDNLDEN